MDRRSTIRVTRRFSAPPGRVFEAWLDRAGAGRWLFATAARPMARVAIDARVGGSFCFADRQDVEAVEYTGEYIEIDPPRRLVFTLSAQDQSHAITRVTVEIAPLGERMAGGTAGAGRPHAFQVEGARTPRSSLTLIHENVPPDHAGRTEARWTGILYGLGVTLEASLDKQRKGPIRLGSRRIPGVRDGLSNSGPAERL